MDNKADTKIGKTFISNRAFNILISAFIVLVKAAELYTNGRDFVNLKKYLISGIEIRNGNSPLKGIGQTSWAIFIIMYYKTIVKRFQRVVIHSIFKDKVQMYPSMPNYFKLDIIFIYKFLFIYLSIILKYNKVVYNKVLILVILY